MRFFAHNPSPFPSPANSTVLLSNHKNRCSRNKIYDSSGKLATKDPQVKRKAENLVSMFQQALFRYYRRMEIKNQPNEEVQVGAEKNSQGAG